MNPLAIVTFGIQSYVSASIIVYPLIGELVVYSLIGELVVYSLIGELVL